MNKLMRCQIAELIEDSLKSQGIKGKTLPFVWSGMLFGSLFDNAVPMNAMSLQEKRSAGLGLVLLAPLIIAGLVLACPFELWMGRKISLHNDRMKKLLLAGSAAPGTENADPGLERAIVDYRVEHEGRAVFFGTALVAFSAERRELLGFTVHRDGPPLRAVDGAAVKGARDESGAVTGELCYWQWNLNDPYELTERPARPW